jgi:hypothetical protein
VIGSLDPLERTIEMRGYTRIAALYQQRWKQPLPIARGEIDALFKRVRAFATSQQLAVIIHEVTESERAIEWRWVALFAGGTAALAILAWLV